MRKGIIIAVSFCLANGLLAQDEIDEDALFSDVGSVIIESDMIVSEGPIEEEKKSIGISGEVISVTEYTYLTGGLEFNEGVNRIFSNTILGNLLFDARLKKGTKAFANLQTVYNPNNIQDKEQWTFKELFIDFNIKNKIYFRTGKQILIWGRSYLWNPSDLINIERNTFIERIGAREGTYGFKIHIPFGTKYNIYGFIDTNNAKEIGAAGKFEFVSGRSEMAFSAWNKIGYKAVYAYDFSTRIHGIDTVGEAAFSYGDNDSKIRVNNGLLEKYQEKDKWITKASINVGKAFDYRDEIDKISINMEFYYNQAGYTKNIFDDLAVYPYGQETGLPDITKRAFMIDNNLYELNHLSKYYMVLFARINKFIRSELALNMNLIGNLSDKSYLFTAGINYRDINDLKLGLLLYFIGGEKNREYTIFGTGYRARATIGMLF